MFSVKDKVIIITGGYGYLGSSLAEGLAREGGNVIVTGTDPNSYRQRFSQQSNIHFEHMDVSSGESIRLSVQRIHQQYGMIDGLVHCAFYASGSDPEHLTDTEWQTGVDGVLGTSYRCIREVIPYLKKQHRGAIITIASMYGMVAPHFDIYNQSPKYLSLPNYGSAKAGVIQLTRYFAAYLAKQNIRVNCISPGAFPAPSVQADTLFISLLKKNIPLARVGSPEELIGPVQFFLSESSSYITGYNLVVDGGWTIV